MKARESGMPEEPMWVSFFDPVRVLSSLGLDSNAGEVVDLGCGYGTFTVPAAQMAKGTVHAFDIDPQMILETRRKAELAGLSNVTVHLRDFVDDGTGLADSGVSYAMLFNILHAEKPVRLLREVYRILEPGGRAGILHWNHDPATPRGPSMQIRPRPGDCRKWARAAGFLIEARHVDLPPYHYGIIARRR